MPQSDTVSAVLSSAKSALAHANTAFPSPKPAPAAPVAPAPKAAPAGIGQELKVKQENVRRYVTAPKMHNGGPVPADGVYSLRAGEHVLTAPEATKARMHALMASGLKSLAKTKGK